ncbi:major facilitator superfamily domain-containing protein 2B-like protein [Lates japonicus]|uniref:Major facilitator superfamily domain-containing protein 2B-like protein n=1 Tax=Lates japonicus TaxID=270547 RepID=A0AAD3MQT5_LATJO|nr:major facilitator superfamily domain-containing protein 2B-like protein [Lates japonicus]
MAAENGRVVTEEQEELPASKTVTHGQHTHTRSQSHIQFQPLTYTTQWQAPHAVAHTRSHSHTHFSTPSHTQPHKYGCRLTHSLSAMAKGEKVVQSSVGRLIKPTDPLFPKTPQQNDLSQGAIMQMVGCTPFLVVSYFYLWFVPPFISGRFIWYLGFYCLYQTLITCFHVPYSALTMFLSTDQKERDSATAYRMTMEVLGTLVGAAIQGQIVASAHTLKHCPTHNTSAGYLGNSSGAEIVKSLVRSQDYLSHSKEVYMIAAGVIGGVFLICTLVMFLGVKERDDPYAPRTEKQIPFHKGFILVMRHGPYLTLTAAFLFITVAIQLVQSNFVLFCTYAADLRDHFQNIVLTILVSAVISIPLWQWFLQRFGKKTAAFCGITWIMPFTLMLVFIPNVVVAYVVAVSSGLSVAASLLLPWSMLPDVVDDFRLANPYSKGHEAIFYSFYVFFTKFAAGISLGVSTLCLEFAGYDTGACKQPAPVVYTLKLLIGAAPVAFIVTGLMILVLYPISEDVRLRNKLCLEELRKQSISSRTMEDLNNV